MNITISDNEKFRQVADLLKKQGANMGHVADSTVAEIAAKGRRPAAKVESTILKFGNVNTKGLSTSNGYKRFSSSVYDSSLGAYRAKGDSRRMMGFKFKNRFGRKTKGLNHSVSTATFTSIVANLQENDTKAYTQSSPFFSNGNQTSRYGIGTIRKGKKYFYSKMFPVFQQAVPIALKQAEIKLTQELIRDGLA